MLEGGEDPREDCTGLSHVVIDEDADGGLHGGDHGRQLGALIGNGDTVDMDAWVSELLSEGEEFGPAVVCGDENELVDGRDEYAQEVRPELVHVISYGGDENRDIFTAVFRTVEDWVGAIEVLTNEVANESAVAVGGVESEEPLMPCPGWQEREEKVYEAHGEADGV